jgi:hypothetical protein
MKCGVRSAECGRLRRDPRRPLRARKPRPPPPKLPGEVDVGPKPAARDRILPSPRVVCAGRGRGRGPRGRQPDPCRTGIEFSPFSRAAGERGRGRGGRLRAPARPRSPIHDPSARGAADASPIPVEPGSNSPLSPAQRGRGAGGEGAPRGRQLDLVRRSTIHRREGPRTPARFPVEPGSNSPLSARSLRGEGPGEGPRQSHHRKTSSSVHR